MSSMSGSLNHALYRCSQFLALNPNERYELTNTSQNSENPTVNTLASFCTTTAAPFAFYAEEFEVISVRDLVDVMIFESLDIEKDIDIAGTSNSGRKEPNLDVNSYGYYRNKRKQTILTKPRVNCTIRIRAIINLKVFLIIE
ncbi:hypothetical protein RN001_012676 [Aquatica leii]|uniref:Uncharacterized protein n=1 Tax=Aquatica leii TaxID=1421715 RepID=A0AAN7SFA4_9COLE|nr:hypothetical protein RN001_012676 [Aquatica leii]